MNLIHRIDELSGNPSARRAWLGLAVAVLLVIIVLPSIFVVTKLFTEWGLVSDVTADSAAVRTIASSVWNSFSIAFVVTMVDIVVGLPMAWILVRKAFKGKRFLDTLLDMPLAFPTAVLGLSVVIFWGMPIEGVEIPGLGLVVSPYLMMVLLHITFTYPYMVRSLSAILEQIEPNYETAAMTLGASKWTAVRTITLPLFRAGLATGFILCFARSLSETGGTYIALMMMGAQNVFFTGPTFISEKKSVLDGLDPGDPMYQQIYDEMMGSMILISVVMIVIALTLLFLVKRIIVRFKIPMKRVWPNAERRLSRGGLPKLRDFAAIFFLLFVVLLPSFYIFAYLTQDSTGVDVGELLSATAVSFLIAGAAVLFDVLMGIPVAMYIARNRDGKLGSLLDNLVNVPLIIPTTALGFSLAMFWGSFGAGDELGLLLVILGHISFTYPLVVRNMTSAIQEVDPAYEEVAMTLGSKPFQAFRKILLPMVKSSVVAGGILAFTRSLGETGATLAISDSVNAVPIYITQLVKDSCFVEAAVCSILLILICFVLMLAVRKLTHGGDWDA